MNSSETVWDPEASNRRGGRRNGDHMICLSGDENMEVCFLQWILFSSKFWDKGVEDLKI